MTRPLLFSVLLLIGLSTSLAIEIRGVSQFLKICIEDDYDEPDTEYPLRDCTKFYEDNTGNQEDVKRLESVFEQSMSRWEAEMGTVWEAETKGERAAATARPHPRPSGASARPGKVVTSPSTITNTLKSADAWFLELTSSKKGKKRAARKNPLSGDFKVWTNPNKKVYYAYDGAVTDPSKKMYEAAVEAFNSAIPRSCLQFEEVPPEQLLDYPHQYVWFQDSERELFTTYHRNDRHRPDYVNIDYRLVEKGSVPLGTFLHEFMHVLGFLHTQQRTDRDRYVNVIADRLDSKCADQYAPAPSGSRDYPTKYDFKSILHYPARACSKLDGKRSMKAKALPPLGWWQERHMGSRKGLTKSDVISIKRAYECRDE